MSLELGIAIVSIVMNIFQLTVGWLLRKNMRAIKGSVQSISDMCNDALTSETFNNPEATKQLIKGIAFATVGVKRQLDTLLPTKKPRNNN